MAPRREPLLFDPPLNVAASLWNSPKLRSILPLEVNIRRERFSAWSLVDFVLVNGCARTKPLVGSGSDGHLASSIPTDGPTRENAEGANNPESLRQKDRRRIKNLESDAAAPMAF